VDPLVAELVILDAGPGERLDAAHRNRLRDDLKASARTDARCILLTVSGDAWHQAPEIDHGDAAKLAHPVVDSEFQALSRQIFRLEVPVVVSLEGKVSGFGFALALTADLRVAKPATAFSLGPPETPAALLGGATWLLSRVMDRGTLTHMAWTGASLSAAEAQQQRMVSEVTNDDAAGRRLAEQLADLPRSAASALKRALVSPHQPDFTAALEYESWLAGVSAEGDT
jgi:2-(1,2-epoxy-1,2-dihydrophenyl)acetyl-CoA isomerase